MIKDIFFIRTRRKPSQTILTTPKTWLQKQFSDQVTIITLVSPKLLVIHIIRFLSGVHMTARSSFPKRDSTHLQDHDWDGQSYLGHWHGAFAGVKENLVSKPRRLLAKSIRFLLPLDNSTNLLQVQTAPNSIQHIHEPGQRGWLASSPSPALRVPAAIPPRKRSGTRRPDRFWTAAQFPDRVTAAASHLEWGLIWDMQKMIIKAGPAVQLAEHCHATREQVFVSPTPGAFCKTSQKVLGKRARFPDTMYPRRSCLPRRAEVTQLAVEPSACSSLSRWPHGECARSHSHLISHWETCSSGYNWLHQFLGTGFPSMQTE